jgi:acid stress-induced BolA-like protein IbaG/YrbA
MVTPENIEGYLSAKLDCEHLAVDGDGAHFQAVIVTSAFEGKSRIQRHQIVYGALGDRMREEIHALSMQTLTPAEWHAKGGAPVHHHH